MKLSRWCAPSPVYSTAKVASIAVRPASQSASSSTTQHSQTILVSTLGRSFVSHFAALPTNRSRNQPANQPTSHAKRLLIITSSSLLLL